tara:strand:- start:1091 stop:1276 length:186 start_codon:yes stop_codon:yes gene_type:complete
MSVELSIHRVSKVELGYIRSNNNTYRSYDVRDIIITHENGQTTTITLFGIDDKEDVLRVFA